MWEAESNGEYCSISLQNGIWISFIHLQTTLCYYDIKDALQLDPDHAEGRGMMERMEKRAQDSKYTAMQLNLMGKHREALQKISIAIETNPAVADFHVLRYETLYLLIMWCLLSFRLVKQRLEFRSDYTPLPPPLQARFWGELGEDIYL